MTTAGSSSFGIGIGYLMDDKVKEELTSKLQSFDVDQNRKN